MKLKKVILCVDDEKIVLTSLQSILFRNFGKQYELEFAESAEEALEIMEELESDGHLPYIIITDWLMPNMKGDEFLFKMKSKYPDVKTIMLSGHADLKAIQLAKDKKYLDYFIAKPWEEQDLVRKILK